MCPGCGTESRRTHSRYQRCLIDTAVDGAEVVIRLSVRRFFRLVRGLRSTCCQALPPDRPDLEREA
jgi:hypothetical protein